MKPAGCMTIVLSTFFILAAITVIVTYSPEQKSKKPSRTSSTTVELKATVEFDGSQFIITNWDYFDWTNIKIEVNSGLISSGYVLREKYLEAGGTYTIGALQFAQGDGTRLNPWQVKPQRFSIRCDCPGGKGVWYGEFK